MKNLLTVAAATMFCLALGIGISAADPSSNALSHVYLTIDPNIGIQAIDSNVNLGTLQTGDIGLPITFRVDANTEAVAISVVATDLYKGNDPTNSDVDPIPVNLSEGVTIQPDHANPIAGGSNVADYVATEDTSTPNGIMTGHRTEEITFESSQNGHFSQNVAVTPSWTNEDNEKPQGEYSGYVLFFAAVVDSLNNSTL